MATCNLRVEGVARGLVVVCDQHKTIEPVMVNGEQSHTVTLEHLKVLAEAHTLQQRDKRKG